MLKSVIIHTMLQKELDLHALAFGKLMGNLLSLEFSLRLYLLNARTDPEVSFPEMENFHSLKKGETISLNPFTSHKYFSKVLKSYNQDSRIKEWGLTIDKTLIDIRNALAHGMISSEKPTVPLTLLHFEKKGTVVQVKMNVVMTLDWFNDNITLVRQEIEKVNRATEMLSPK